LTYDRFMRRGDFFSEDPAARGSLNAELIDAVAKRPLADRTDLEVAIGLARLVHDELESYATDNQELTTDEELIDALAALRSVLRRLDIIFKLPFRDYASFRTYWIKEGLTGSGSWQARRELLEDLFGHLHEELDAREDMSFADLAEPVSPRGALGWPAVDEEVRELRRRFQTAATSQDYRALGTNCVGVLEALSRVVYDPAKHLRDGEEEPPVDKTKQRLGRFVEVALPGAPNEELRGLINKAIELAHRVKHSESGTRRMAGIAADAVILLANILRRLDDDA
jgi:hypothetical protein